MGHASSFLVDTAKLSHSLVNTFYGRLFDFFNQYTRIYTTCLIVIYASNLAHQINFIAYRTLKLSHCTDTYFIAYLDLMSVPYIKANMYFIN